MDAWWYGSAYVSRAASTASRLSASRLKNQIPGLSAYVTYVRTLSSRKLESRGTGNVARSRSPSTRNGVIPSHHEPSNESSGSSSGTCFRSARSGTRQWAKSRCFHVWAWIQERHGSGQGRWSTTSSVAVWRDGVSRRSRRLEVASKGLLTLDRLEERLEVALAERRRAVPLDHLEEDRRPVLRGLGEDLEQVAVLVAVGEDPKPLEVAVVLVDVPDAPLDLLVVGLRCVEEEDAALLHRGDRPDDVLALERDVLHTGTAVELEVLLDLALALAFGRIVDRELDLAAAVGHDLGHQRGILRLNLVVAEVDDVRHPEDALVEPDPVVHAAELDVADDVVECLQPHTRDWLPVHDRRLVAGHERPHVVGAVDERVDHVAVRSDRGQLDAAELVVDPVRLLNSAGAALHCLPVCLTRARYLERDAPGAVSVPARELRDFTVHAHPAREHEANVALLEHVRRAVADAGLRPGVRGSREAEGVLVEVRGLLGVADPELEMIPALERHEIVRAHRRILDRSTAVALDRDLAVPGEDRVVSGVREVTRPLLHRPSEPPAHALVGLAVKPATHVAMRHPAHVPGPLPVRKPGRLRLVREHGSAARSRFDVVLHGRQAGGLLERGHDGAVKAPVRAELQKALLSHRRRCARARPARVRKPRRNRAGAVPRGCRRRRPRAGARRRTLPPGTPAGALARGLRAAPA